MKKAKSSRSVSTGKGRSSAKRKGPAKSVDQYIARASQPGRRALKQIRAAIRSVAPAEATEIISYGIPAFKHKKVLVWFAAFSDHCSLFPTASVIEQFKGELKGYSSAKGTVHFALEKPMPTALIKKLVKARVAEVSKATS